MRLLFSRRALGAILTLGLTVLAATPAFAGVCFTSGKVYIQQKVWDKAALQLECARKQEPDNIQLYSLLGIARGELKEYASSGAAFAIGIQVATKKKDEKKVADLKNNQMAYMSRLYNQGVKAMSLAGTVPAEPDSSAMSFPGFAGAASPTAAITDTTVYPGYTGTSKIEEATYYFRLASMIDPNSVDTYRNLSYLYALLGRADDSMAAARAGLALAPNDEKLARNLRAAAVGRANRLYQNKQFLEAIPEYRKAAEVDTAGRLLYKSQIASSFYLQATSLDDKAPQRPAMLDSAAIAYQDLLKDTPTDSLQMRETAYYNIIVIYSNQSKFKEAIPVADKAAAEFPKSKDILSLAGQVKFNANDFSGAVTVLKQAVALDPKDAVPHQFLFLSLSKMNKQSESVAEYSIYKALSEGSSKTGAALKAWVDSADNRLGPNHQLKKTLTSEGGYPEEVRIFHDNDKTLESWFYWSKGKVVTFMEGQVLSQATFPPSKS